MKGVFLDCQPAGRRIRLWIKAEGRVVEGYCDYRPRIYLISDVLGETATELSKRGICSEQVLVRDLITDAYTQVLAVSAPDCEGLPSFVRRIERLGEYRWRLYNADLGADQMFIYERRLPPLSWVECEMDDDAIRSISVIDDCADPGLTASSVRVFPEYDPRRDFDCKVRGIEFDGRTFDGCEQDILLGFKSAYEVKDPDVVLVEDGDRYATEYLLNRFKANGIPFCLGRRSQGFRARAGKSYFSYGRVIRRDPSHYLAGRYHIDSSGFMFREGGLEGIFELARLSYLPVQKAARLSPGAVISNLYVATAYQMGYPIPYKWNMVEDFKPVRRLLEADKGGFIFEPKVGFHTDVAELDFVSLYPHIMVNHNISPETVLCRCCRGENLVPYAGYNICGKRRGLVPQVIAPLIGLRIRYKGLYGKTGEKRYKAMADALKWVLVTSFGYTGYKRSRFARIEAHESITSYARHILQAAAKLSEDMGFEVLHGIVDSIWVQKPGLGAGGVDLLRRRIEERFRIPVKSEGVYRWVVFLPSVRNPMAPVPNRYYGVFENGEIKARGIELRRGDSPKVVKDFQQEVLAYMADAATELQFMARIPGTLKILAAYNARLSEGAVSLDELAIEKRISRGKYRANNPQRVVVDALAANGVDIHPGECVRYVIRDSGAEKAGHRYVPLEYPLDGCVDACKYSQMLAKSLESLFLPFGYGYKRIIGELAHGVQTTLGRWS
ncbi:MAG: DNA polymerase domain-containing protein [Candidatus Altiarchaeota archaeon]